LSGVDTAIIGCRTPAEVDDNVRIACLFPQFDEERMRALEQRTDRAAEQLTSYKKPPPHSLD
jgi:hypothetical protein